MRKKILLLGIFILGLFPVLEQGKLKLGLLQEAFAGGWGDEYGGGGYDNGGSNNYDFLSDYYGVDITGYKIGSDGHFYFLSPTGNVPVGEAVTTGQFTPLVQTIFPEYQPEPYQDPNDAYNQFLGWLDEYNNTPPLPLPPPVENPCNQQAQAAGTAATHLLSQPSVNSSVQALAAGLTPTLTGQVEKGFPIYKEDATGTVSSSAIQSGTPGNLQVNISIPAYPGHTALGYVHTHPAEAYPGPSAGDLYSLIGLNGTLNTVTTAFVIAADGTKYAMAITDPAKLAAFLTANPASTSVNGSDFISTSDIGKQFGQVEQSFQAQGYNDKESHERAMATVMKNSGITLLKAPVNSSTFKKIDTQQVKDANGNPVKDGNGNNMYLKIDC